MLDILLGSVIENYTRSDLPAARGMAVAIELQRRNIVGGADAAGDGETLVGLHVLALEGVAYPADEPAARRMVVAIELQRRDIVLGADAAGNGQAFAGLQVPDLELVAE